MENEKYLKDIQDIKKMMNKSSRFLSLSGLSGILAGFYALTGAFLANNIIKQTFDSRYIILKGNEYISESIFVLLLIAFVVLILSILTGIVLSSIKAKKARRKTLGQHIKEISYSIFNSYNYWRIICNCPTLSWKLWFYSTSYLIVLWFSMCKCE